MTDSTSPAARWAHHAVARAVIGALGVILAGCATPGFSQYSGQQQTWPTQPGSFVNTQFGLPIYVHSYPSRHYVVLGYLETLETPVWVRYAVGKAKALNADALIVSEGGYAGSFSSGNAYTNANVYPGGLNANTTSTGFSMALMKAEFIAIKYVK
jgi:hypothetical protein